MDALNKTEQIYRNEICRYRLDAAPEDFTRRCRESDTRFDATPENPVFFDRVLNQAKTVEIDFHLSARDAVSVIACANELADVIAFAAQCGVENIFSAAEYLSHLSAEGNRLIWNVYENSDETSRSTTALLTRFFRTAHAVTNVSVAEGLSVLKALRCFTGGKEGLKDFNIDRIRRKLDEEGASFIFEEDEAEEYEFDEEDADDWDKDYAGMPSADLLLEDLDENALKGEPAADAPEENGDADTEEGYYHVKNCSFAVPTENGREILIDVYGEVNFNNLDLDEQMDAFAAEILDFARQYLAEHYPGSIEVSEAARIDCFEDDEEAPF